MLTWIKREYIQLGWGGAFCTMTASEACDQLQDADDPKGYKVRSVWMTDHQFNSMPEFKGY